MIATPVALDIPIYMDENGQFRIGKTRVLLHLVIHAFNLGETAEGIIESYPSLSLADVYAVIAYYLKNRADVDAYIHQIETDEIRIQHEAESHYSDEHKALLARLRAFRDNPARKYK